MFLFEVFSYIKQINILVHAWMCYLQFNDITSDITNSCEWT